MTSTIIKVSQKYRDRLYRYLLLLHPEFNEKYVTFCVDEALNVENPQSLLVVNDNDKIVGCHLFFETKVWIKGEERTVVWGHDTYLDEDCRQEIGLDFVFAIATTKNMFGYGLSDVNRKIQELMPTIAFIGDGMKKFCLFNPWIIWGVIKRITGASAILKVLPNELKLKDVTFKLCSSVEHLAIPNKGYWNKDVLDVDFVRDDSFMNKRFFHNPVHKYYVYVLDGKDAFFVVRPILFKNIQTLFLVDFRYDMKIPQELSVIFDAAELLCRKMRIGVMLFTTNDINVVNRYAKHKWCKTKHVDLIAYNKSGVSSQTNMLVTAADSDGEFHK